MAAWGWRRWGRFSSSELCKDEGSTSETPESAGLGGSDPKRKRKQNKVKFSTRPNTNCLQFYVSSFCALTLISKFQIKQHNLFFSSSCSMQIINRVLVLCFKKLQCSSLSCFNLWIIINIVKIIFSKLRIFHAFSLDLASNS